MSYERTTRDQAREMYVNEGRTPEQISHSLQVALGTVYRWKKNERWDDYIKAGGQIGIALKVQQEFMEKLMEAIKEKKLTDPGTADSLVKISKVVEKLMPKAVTLSNIFNLFDVLVEFVTNHTDANFIKTFQRYMPEMSNYIRSKFASLE